jgi:uncharacterized protein YndB with AHSA1/START domain
MLQIIVIAAGAAIAGVLGIAAARPNTFRIQRSAAINAPPETIYPLLADFHAWSGWSPWEKLDPAMDRTFSGAASGTGAVYGWAGRKVGEGRMEITSASPPSALTIKLDFLKPFEAHNTTTFTLQSRGGATEVTWAMEGPSSFKDKVMGVVMNMDRMIGKSFDEGLATLKAIAEGQAAAR